MSTKSSGDETQSAIHNQATKAGTRRFHDHAFLTKYFTMNSNQCFSNPTLHALDDLTAPNDARATSQNLPVLGKREVTFAKEPVSSINSSATGKKNKTLESRITGLEEKKKRRPTKPYTVSDLGRETSARLKNCWAMRKEKWVQLRCVLNLAPNSLAQHWTTNATDKQRGHQQKK